MGGGNKKGGDVKRSKTGFTLVELMVVAIIVAVLAAVSIPLMTGNKKRAAGTEGETGLGTVRTALRVIRAESGSYDRNASGQPIAAGPITQISGSYGIDLNGKYFVADDYSIASISSNAFIVQVTVSSSGIVAGVIITLDQDGHFARSGM